MPDLGKYAGDVLLAYGATLVLLGGLIVLTWVQSRRRRAALEKAEEGLKDG